MIVCVSQDSVFCVVLVSCFGEGVSEEQILMLFGKMGFGDGSSFLLMISVNSFLVPIGNEGAFVRREVPWVLGLLLL